MLKFFDNFPASSAAPVRGTWMGVNQKHKTRFNCIPHLLSPTPLPRTWEQSCIIDGPLTFQYSLLLLLILALAIIEYSSTATKNTSSTRVQGTSGPAVWYKATIPVGPCSWCSYIFQTKPPTVRFQLRCLSVRWQQTLGQHVDIPPRTRVL